jgi:hypothetical protein
VTVSGDNMMFIGRMGSPRRLTDMQQAAVDYLQANFNPDVDDVIRVAGVQGYDDNQGTFLLRLLRTGVVRLTLDPEYRKD